MEYRLPFGGTFKSDPPTGWPMQVHTPHPHTCPICGGKGTVPPGFYGEEMATCTVREKCRACGGRGIVIA